MKIKEIVEVNDELHLCMRRHCENKSKSNEHKYFAIIISECKHDEKFLNRVRRYYSGIGFYSKDFYTYPDLALYLCDYHLDEFMKKEAYNFI